MSASVPVPPVCPVWRPWPAPSVGSVASIKLDSDTDGCVPATPAPGHCPHRQQSSVDVKQIFVALTSEFLCGVDTFLDMYSILL